jgi:hypothetical protein
LRKQTCIAFATIALIVSMAIAFSVSIVISATPEEISQSGKPPASAIETVGSYYLTSPPNFPNNSYKITKIYLENATLWYGYSNEKLDADIEFDVPDGMFFFMVNGTIRNDYTGSEIVTSSQEGVSDCTIGLDIYLYDAQGNFISTLNRGNPFRGCYEVSLISSEEANFKVAFAVPEKNVAHFEVYIRYLDPLPLF